MTATLISLISIVFGILGAYIFAAIFRKYTFDLVGNTIAGVFGGILFIKSFGRLGFDPVSIVNDGNINWLLFIVNLLISFLGGALCLYFFKILKEEMSSTNGVKDKTIQLFKGISFLEGVSYILLLFVAVPLKYLGDNAFFVKALGMPHGILFMAYVVMTFVIKVKLKLDIKTTLLFLIASLLPFGTFYINKKYFGNWI